MIYCSDVDLYCETPRQVGIDLSPGTCPPVGVVENCRNVTVHSGGEEPEEEGLVGYKVFQKNLVPQPYGEIRLGVATGGYKWYPADIVLHLGDVSTVTLRLCLSATFPDNDCPLLI